MIIKRDSAVGRIIVITYHFPPDGAIGGQRWAGLSKYLARLGWEVHVITASPPILEQTAQDVHRHFRHRRRTLNELYNSAVRRFRHPSEPDRQPIPEDSHLQHRPLLFRTVTAARRVMSTSMYFPDYGRGWVGRAAKAARGLLRECEFDVVISSGPPHSAHFAGLWATRGRDEQFWIDMRDPWSATHARHMTDDGFVRAERFLLSRFERLLFQRAKRVIVNTPEFASALRHAEPGLDVVYFPNGIDLEELPLRDETRVKRCSIACIGALYAGRDLSSVFAAMGELRRDRPEVATMLRLDIAGPIESGHRQRLSAGIASAGITDVVHIHGMLPRAEALQLLSHSHLALVLAQDQPMQIPGKLYECLGLGVPTLVIAEETSAAAREARRIGAMTMDGGDVDGMRSLLEDMLAGRIPIKIEPKTPISYEALAVQMDRLILDAVRR